MTDHNPLARRPRRLSVLTRASLALGLGLVLAACGKDETAPTDAGTAATTPAGSDAAAPVTPDTAISDEVSALSAEQLRDAARQAYGDNRLYAPAGNNAVEYYLALRDKAPGDAAVSSALIDLLPMTVIATEQSVNREDFDEARRLAALLEKAEPQHPALDRLKNAIATREKEAAEQAEQEKLTAQQEAEREEQLERERLAEQKRQQEEAARQLAVKQAAEREAAERRQAEEAAAAQRAAAQPAATAQTRPQPPAPPTADDLRPISTRAPEFPREALRSGRSGEVVVEYTVAPNGSVSDARVIRSSPPRVFDRAALDAVRSWRFQPVSAPVTVRRTIGFNPGG